MVNLLQPTGPLAVEFCQRADPLAGQAQARFEVLLQGTEHPLDFAPAPRPAHLGMNEANAQVSADDAQVVVDKGSAVVSVMCPAALCGRSPPNR